MPRPLARTGITVHTQKHFTSGDKAQKKKKNILMLMSVCQIKKNKTNPSFTMLCRYNYRDSAYTERNPRKINRSDPAAAKANPVS